MNAIERGENWGLNVYWRATLAASAVATAALHGYLEVKDYAHGPRVENVWERYRDDGTTRDVTPIGPGRPDMQRITEVITVPGEREQLDELSFAVALYAQEFSDDPAVEIVDVEAANTLSDRIASLENDGWQDLLLTATGYASAEDESEAPDGGVQTPSIKNQLLAGLRADVFLAYLQESGLFPAGRVGFAENEPVEGSWSDTEYAHVEELASELEFGTVKDLIDAWNGIRSGTIPPEVAALFDRLLASDRRVDITITGTRPGEAIQETVTVNTKVCKVPSRETITSQEHSEPFDATLPIPAIVPVVWPRRKQRGDEFVVGSGFVRVPTKKDYRAVERAKATTYQKRLVANYEAAKSREAEEIRARVAAQKRKQPKPQPTPPTPPAKDPTPTTPKPAEKPVPTQPLVTEPTPPRNKERRKWPWILPIPIAIGIGGLLLRSCDDDPSKYAVPPPAIACADDLPRVPEIVETVHFP